MKNPHKFWIIFSIIILYTVGKLTGVLLEKYFFEKKLKKGIPYAPTLEKMAQDLSLTELQTTKIRDIFQKNDIQFKAFARQIRKKLAKIRTQLKEEIKAVLDEEQGKKFDLLIEEHVAKIKKIHEKRRKDHETMRKEKGENK